MKNPCFNCEKVGCGAYHDKCEKYKEYNKECIKRSKWRFDNRTLHQKPYTVASTDGRKRLRVKGK